MHPFKYYEVMFFLAVLVKNTGRPESKKMGTIDSARDERNEDSAKLRQVIGNPENNIVYSTCRNLEINPPTEISLSSVTILCSVQCTRIHLLHALRASVKDSLLFFVWI